MQLDFNDLLSLTRLFNTSEEISLVHNWPPAYGLRISPRAKRITVQISPKRGLEIVAPQRKRPISELQAEAILNEHRGWIERHLKIWSKTQAEKKQESLLPQKIVFPAFQQEIYVEYQPNESSQIRIKLSQQSEQDPADLIPLSSHIHDNHQDFSQTIMIPTTRYFIKNNLILSGATDNTDKMLIALRKFLSQQAHYYLIPMLNQLSRSSGLAYSHATIRRQTSLWGSCTVSKKISLNAKLLFLPNELVRYVLLHELCHTEHMNHSSRFWNLLKKFDPLCLEHRRALRKAAVYLPRWIE